MAEYYTREERDTLQCTYFNNDSFDPMFSYPLKSICEYGFAEQKYIASYIKKYMEDKKITIEEACRHFSVSSYYIKEWIKEYKL